MTNTVKTKFRVRTVKFPNHGPLEPHWKQKEREEVGEGTCSPVREMHKEDTVLEGGEGSENGEGLKQTESKEVVYLSPFLLNELPDPQILEPTPCSLPLICYRLSFNEKRLVG